MRNNRRIRVLALAASITGPSVLAFAATFTVNTTDVLVRGNCSPLCSLPDAMLLAHDGDLIAFNIGGGGHQVIDAIGSSALFSTNGHVMIDGSTQPGAALAPLIEVKGAAFGLASGSSMNGLALNDGSQVISSAGSIISNNFIGTDFTGINPSGPPPVGIQSEGDGAVIQNNVVVATRPIALVSNFNSVEGNFINTNAIGTTCIGPAANDKSVYVAGFNFNKIGGTTVAERNVICAPGPGAIAVELIGDNNLVQGNFIGINRTGDGALPVGVGVDVNGDANRIGDPQNVIVAAIGVQIAGSNTVVVGNNIGTDALGHYSLAPAEAVGILDGGSATLIGGSATVEGNVVSGNKQGIIAGGNGATIVGNFIGTERAIFGAAPIPNTLVGVRVITSGSPGVTIDSNAIAYNNNSGTGGYGGILVGAGSTQCTITSNIIRFNGGRGIVLGGFLNPPPNDDCDVDSGANGLQNYPVLTSAVSNGTSTTIQGTLDSTASTTFVLEFFSNLACDPSGFGQGEEILFDTAMVTTDASCHASFSAVVTPAASAGDKITATATDPLGNTSEFSACVTATGTGHVSVDGITPTSGSSAGGTSVAVHGSGFAANATVQIGGLPATGVTVVTPGLLTATTPALPAGLFDDVTVSEGALSGTLQVGWLADFLDVPQGDIFHPAVEQIYRWGITAGCGGGNYCRNAPVRRDQMAVFLEKAKRGAGFVPPPCTGIFPDVPCPGFFSNWIEWLFTDGITGGCGGGLYCPSSPVTRQQMAVFLLKTEHGSMYMPPACAGVFGDVACPSQFADWIENLYGDGVTGGCQTNPTLLYCPTNEVTRGQMAAFLVKLTF